MTDYDNNNEPDIDYPAYQAIKHQLSPEINDLYEDLAACLLALSKALVINNVTTKAQLLESFQERLWKTQHERADSSENSPYYLLRELIAQTAE